MSPIGVGDGREDRSPKAVELGVALHDVSPGCERENDSAAIAIDRLPHRSMVPGRIRAVDSLFWTGLASNRATLAGCDRAGTDLPQSRSRELSSALAWGDIASESVVVHGVLADLLRRAGRYDDALAACATGEAALDPSDEADAPTATVLAFIRRLAQSQDDELHNAAKAFAIED